MCDHVYVLYYSLLVLIMCMYCTISIIILYTVSIDHVYVLYYLYTVTISIDHVYVLYYKYNYTVSIDRV